MRPWVQLTPVKRRPRKPHEREVADPAEVPAAADASETAIWEALDAPLMNRIVHRSVDHDRVTGPVPGDPANTHEVVSGFELGKVHFRRESRRAILEFRVAAGR